MASYPFPITYGEPDLSSWHPGWKIWSAYDDNWTDGAYHKIALTPEGQWVDIRGVTYDGPENFQYIPGNPEDRIFAATAPYVARYTTRDKLLYCPNGHRATLNYPYPGCSQRECPFLRYRQHHLAQSRDEARYGHFMERVFPMEITINGEPFVGESKGEHNS